MSEELIKRLRTVARDEERAWGDEDEVVILLREAADALESSPAPAVQVPEGYVKLVRVLAFVDAVATDAKGLRHEYVESRSGSMVKVPDFHALAAAPTPAPVATEAVAQVWTQAQVDAINAEARALHGVGRQKPQAEPVAQGGGVDAFDAAVEAARNLGTTQAKRMAGVYTQADSVVERGLHEAIAKHRRALLASAPAGAVGDGWMPIETAPKDGTFFIATGFNYGKSSEPRHYCMALWEQGEWREASEWNGHSSLAYLTHWQPLPPAPAATKEGE